MKIGAFSVPEISLGKHNAKDTRLDKVCDIVKPKKKTYIQVEVTGEPSLQDTEAIIALKDSRTDLILKDLEFVETRMTRATEDAEKALLAKLKQALEKEDYVFNLTLSEEEKKSVAVYGLLTNKPVIALNPEDLAALDGLWIGILKDSGYISFFTAGEKETRAWLIKKGTTAWEASGSIHSDIQKGFIRAEVIGYDDFIQSGGETQAKQAGKMRLEQKEYIMQDADIVNFRFNK